MHQTEEKKQKRRQLRRRRQRKDKLMAFSGLQERGLSYIIRSVVLLATTLEVCPHRSEMKGGNQPTPARKKRKTRASSSQLAPSRIEE
ncbi:hypothetical protein LIER_32921 [Lithospermum erythrorhizon]|uniref:Uncharacterized protein n=1 Tax=Lithospermum erythrorhizon TaxID=34254 RepID=A0AAV3RWY5_LITER